jgi:feruloyl esterase
MFGTAALMLAATLAGAAQCESLRSLALPHATITSAQLVEAGPFVPPGREGPPPAAAAADEDRGQGRGGRAGAATPQMLPASCRVAAVLTPSADSHVEMEVWMPAESWNGKFQMVGNGGWAGIISYPAMASALLEGYATASTDTGHKGANALFAIGHPEKLLDFAYRAVHETAVQSKAIVKAFYGRAPRLSYWNGCSTGGRQGLMAAQKYPDDFDGILVGAPANYQSHMHVWDLSVASPVLNDPTAAVPAVKLALVRDAVVKACDARDGVTDGLLNNPLACTFDVSTLACESADKDTCLTTRQVAAVKRMYAPLNAPGGEVVFPGKAPGSETGWGYHLGGRQPFVSVGSFQIAHGDENWDSKSFDLARDLTLVDDKVGSIVNAIEPNLNRFKRRGGKLLLYHGWDDPLISPGNSIDYYLSVLERLRSARQDDWMRLFMVPGMGHCAGGPGPNQVNWMAALERWRESNVAPDEIEAAHVTGGRVDMTRPLCPYPQVATYKGMGDTNDAANFVCKSP